MKPYAFWVALVLLYACGCTSSKQAPKTERHDTAQQAQPAPTPTPRPSFEDTLRQAAARPTTPFEGNGWQSMFDGKTRAGWRETKFAGGGEIQCQDGLIVLNMGDPFTGINWTNSFPKMNYEIALDAMRVAGADFFCGLTVPVGDSFCSLIVGGWGGSLVGISSLDGLDASENETMRYFTFESGRWYRIRLRVTEGKIQAWIDREKVIDVVTTGKRISLRPGDIELSKPVGLASWQTTAALREIKIRQLD